MFLCKGLCVEEERLGVTNSFLEFPFPQVHLQCHFLPEVFLGTFLPPANWFLSSKFAKHVARTYSLDEVWSLS